jgi:serine/threonine protein kinase
MSDAEVHEEAESDDEEEDARKGETRGRGNATTTISKGNKNTPNRHHAGTAHQHEVLFEDNVDFEHLSDLVEGLRDARDEALHHLEVAERTLSAERSEHASALRAKDREIFFLKAMIRQNIHEGLPATLKTKKKEQGATEAKTVASNGNAQDKDGEDDADSSDSDGSIVTLNNSSLWHRRKSSMKNNGLAFVPLVLSFDDGELGKDDGGGGAAGNSNNDATSTTTKQKSEFAKRSPPMLVVAAVGDDGDSGCSGGGGPASPSSASDATSVAGRSTPNFAPMKIAVAVTNSKRSSNSSRVSGRLLETGGFGIDEFGIVSTPKGSYKRPSDATGNAVESDLLRLGYLGRGAGGVVYKSLHMPTLRICAVKCVGIYDEQHRDQLVSEVKALRSNLVSWQYAACAGCGRPEHEISARKGTPRRCILCAKLFCGEDKHAFMVKTGLGHGTWKCKDNCETTMFDDTLKVAHAALNSVLHAVHSIASSGGSSGRQSFMHRLFTPSHKGELLQRGAASPALSAVSVRSVSGTDSGHIFAKLRETLLSRSASKLPAEQQHLIRQLILSGMAEKRGARMPHLVELYQVFTSADGTKVSIVMEFMDGGSLEDVVLSDETLSVKNSIHGNKRKGLDFSYLKSIARQCLGGLVLLHRKKLLHRDIKPANILLKQDGQVKLADFGIAAQAEAGGDIRAGGGAISGQDPTFTAFVGTMAYMAPERLKGSSTYSFPSDIWSLGLSLYVAATGAKPWTKGLTQFELITTIVEGPPPTLDASLYPADLVSFLALCLQMNPSNRPTALALLKHPFLTVTEDEVKTMARRRSTRFTVGSPYNQAAQRRMDNIIENLYEHYHTTWMHTDGALGPMPSFEKESVQSLASQLGVWPLTALRKFQKLEQSLMVVRNELIAEDRHNDRNSGGDDDGEVRSWSSEVDYVSMPKRHHSAGSSENSLGPMLDSQLSGGQFRTAGGEMKASSGSFKSRDSMGRLSVEGFSLKL